MTTRVPRRVALLGAGLFAVVAIPAAGAAYASTATHHPAGATTHATHSTHSTKPKKKSFTVTTKVADVQIRTKPDNTKATKILAVVKTAGTALTVTCYKTGTAVNADTTWYHTVAPKHGYVAGADLSIATKPLAGVPKCTTKPTKPTK